MNADPPEELPAAPVADDALLDASSAHSGDELELDTSRPSEAVLRAPPIAVERGLDLAASAPPASGEVPPLELAIDAPTARARPHDATSAAGAPTSAALPRWLTIALALSLLALAAAVGSTWLR